MTKPYTCPEKFYDPLGFVTTVPEAAAAWCRHRSTIIAAIHAENIAAVKSGKTWLISVPSLVAFWGHPPALSGASGYTSRPATPLQIIAGGGRNRESGAV